MSDPIMEIVPTLESLAQEVKMLRKRRDDLTEALKAMCDMHGNMAFAVGSTGRPPSHADWMTADKVLADARNVLKGRP